MPFSIGLNVFSLHRKKRTFTFIRVRRHNVDDIMSSHSLTGVKDSINIIYTALLRFLFSTVSSSSVCKEETKCDKKPGVKIQRLWGEEGNIFIHFSIIACYKRKSCRTRSCLHIHVMFVELGEKCPVGKSVLERNDQRIDCAGVCYGFPRSIFSFDIQLPSCCLAVNDSE